MPHINQAPADHATSPFRSLPRWLAVVGVIALLGVTAGIWLLWNQLSELMSFKAIGLNYAHLKDHVAAHHAKDVMLYITAYAALGACVLPGSALFVVASGLLFGATLGIPLAAFASTLAASLGFLAARTVLGNRLNKLSNPMFHSFRAGFARHALGYMLFLRLTPGLPFALINAGPGLIGVPFRTFLLGTALGILPSRIALSTAGAGLGHAIEAENAVYSQCATSRTADSLPCNYDIHIASLLTKETLAAFVALAFLALVPAIMDAAPHVWRRLKAR